MLECLPGQGVQTFVLSTNLNISNQGSVANPMQNKSGSGDMLLLLIVVCCITLVVFWVVRSRKRRSTILEIQKSVAESSANGITNLSLVMAMVIIVSIAFSALVSNLIFQIVALH